MSPPILAVFGATGAQGGGLARAILDDPRRRFRLRAVTRRPDSERAQALARRGAEVVVADLDDAPSVERAMRGAHGAFCVTNFWEHLSADREVAQAQAMAQAAARAAVAHVVWSTLEDTRDFIKPGSGYMPLLGGKYNVPHYDGKGEGNHAFASRDVPTTFLYTSFYWDNLIHFGMGPRRVDGRAMFLLPMGGARLPGIAADDIGACAFAIFARGEQLLGKSVGIAGEHLTGAQMAEQLGLALGEPVEHAPLAPQEYAALGFPGAQDLANMFHFKRDFEHAYGEARRVECTRLLHPAVQTFAAWLARHKPQLVVA